MCKELYQRWKGCDCWGFLKADTCSGLFRTCFGPRGERDKKGTPDYPVSQRVFLPWNDL